MLKIIAEAATCHGGQLELAKQLIRMAADAGADTVKFQHIVPESLYSTKILESGEWIPNPAILKRTKERLSHSELLLLKNFADDIGIEFALTLFDVESLKLVDELGLPFVKVASGDLSFTLFLNQIGKLPVPVIMSTGMSSISEIEIAIDALNLQDKQDLTLLHCVSVYPCEARLVNLNRILVLKELGFRVGYSDHTLGDWAAHTAVGLGASVIEKHIRLKNGPVTSDYDHSMIEDEFKRFVTSLREVDKALCNNGLALSDEERIVKARARRGVYASKDIESIISLTDLTFLRPESDFGPMDYRDLIGRRVKQLIPSGHPILKKYLE